MAWVDVVARIRFWAPGGPTTINGLPVSDYGSALAFAGTDQTRILSDLQDLYDLSATARELLDAGTAARDIWLVNITGPSGSFPGSGTAGINLTLAQTFQWMGRDGQIKTDRLGGHIIHELIHAIDGLYDLTDPTTGASLGSGGLRDYNDPAFDHLGLTVQKQNQIFQEMGWGAGYWQAGYDAIVNGANESILRTDISYTEGQIVDIAYFDSASNKTPNYLDLSFRTDNSNDLIIGFGGNDWISGGAGRDYLYGSVGDDELSGGSGDDLVHGGDRKTPIATDGIDTADYSKGDMGIAPPHGITVTIDARTVPDSAKMDGYKPIIVTDDGYGGADRLFSVEKIKLSDLSDRVIVTEHLDGYALTGGKLKIDGSDAKDASARDVIDFAGNSDPVVLVNATGAGNAGWIEARGSGLQFENFEEAYLTSGNDIIRVSVPGFIVHTGGGEDEIQVSNGIGIADLSPNDQIALGDLDLFGGERYIWSESPWARSFDGAIKWGINGDGELVINAGELGTMYVLNWAGSGGMSGTRICST